MVQRIFRSRLVVAVLSWFMIGLFVAGCGSGAVQFAPTPLPPDMSPLTYEHPSGAFALVLPPDWSVYAQNLTTLASASFAPPNSDNPLLVASVVNLGEAIDARRMGELMLQYQTQVRSDLERYTERERQAMGDGSWRLSGLRQIAGGGTQQVNTFVQRRDRYLAIIEVIVPTNTALQSDLQRIVNTFRIGDAPELPVSGMSAFASLAASQLSLANVNTWTTRDGVLFITGEIANHSDIPVSGVPVRGVLVNANQEGIAEAVDVAMGYTIVPGALMPFSLRFGQGMPPDAVNYQVTFGSETWQRNAVIPVVDDDVLVWTSEISVSQDGQLFVTGTIENTGDNPVQQPRAIATIFDQRGLVIGAGFADAQDVIVPPGAQTPYTILINDVGGEPVTSIVTAQAIACDTGECG